MAAATSGTATVTLPTDTQILITREFDAPRHLVFEAWTTPEHIERWWSGGRGEVTVAEVDLRVGGRWRYAMQVDAGFEVGFHGEYKEIVPNERLVNTEVFEGLPDGEGGMIGGGEALNTITFTEVDGRTRMECLVEHETREERDAHVESGMEGGMQDSMDELERVAISLA
jgi:uncharacterized protein YndB with AHSA1/START domain